MSLCAFLFVHTFLSPFFLYAVVCSVGFMNMDFISAILTVCHYFLCYVELTHLIPLPCTLQLDFTRYIPSNVKFSIQMFSTIVPW